MKTPGDGNVADTFQPLIKDTYDILYIFLFVMSGKDGEG